MYPPGKQVDAALHKNTLGDNEHDNNCTLCDIEFVFK